MTYFEAIEGTPDISRLHTTIGPETYDILETIKAMGGVSFTDSVHRATAWREDYEQRQKLGHLVIVDTGERIEPVNLPPEIPLGQSEKGVELNINVNSHVRAALDPRIDTSNPLDLVGYWHSTIKLYSDLNAHGMTGAKFYSLKPGMRRIVPLRLGDVFQEPPERKSRLQKTIDYLLLRD
jgi:hypothetical protein